MRTDVSFDGTRIDAPYIPQTAVLTAIVLILSEELVVPFVGDDMEIQHQWACRVLHHPLSSMLDDFEGSFL